MMFVVISMNKEEVYVQLDNVKERQVETDTYLLQAKNIKKYFPIKGGILKSTVGHVKAVDGVSLNIKKGRHLELLGNPVQENPHLEESSSAYMNQLRDKSSLKTKTFPI